MNCFGIPLVSGLFTAGVPLALAQHHAALVALNPTESLINYRKVSAE